MATRDLKMRVLLLTLGCLMSADSLLAAPTTYLHATDPSCLGNAPCFDTIEEALQNVDNGGTVIILSDISGSIRSTEGRQNITLMGMPPTVEVGTQILLEEVVTGWTIKDLEMTTSCIIEDVAGSITIDNVTANIIKIGDLTQDTTANIVIRDSTVRSGGPLSIIGAPGSSLGGSILIQNNSAGAIVVKLDVAPGPPTLLNSNVAILDNVVVDGGGVQVVGEGAAGTGAINGAVEFSRNVGTAADSKFGVITFGNVSGDINGPVTFRDNDLAWLAILTTGSITGGLGQLTMTGNLAEALEIVTNGGAIAGPVLVQDNQVLDLGGGTGLENPLLLIDGDGGVGAVTLLNNTAPDADVVTRAESGSLSGQVRVIGNTAAILTVDSRGGDFGLPIEVVGNILPTSADPNVSRMTIRSQSNGDSVGGTIDRNETDELTINFAGFLAGDLQTTNNIVRRQATIVGSGNLGGAIQSLIGNDFLGDTLLNGIDSTVRFNRFGGDVSIIVGTVADATRNWWKCNGGPGAPGCSSMLVAGAPFDPWLTFSGEASCSGSAAVGSFDVLTASDNSVPAGNVTPGSVVVTSPHGTVVGSPVELSDGAGCAPLSVDAGQTNPLIQMQLDAQLVSMADDCTSGPPPPPCAAIFADGFESGNTSAWSTSVF